MKKLLNIRYFLFLALIMLIASAVSVYLFKTTLARLIAMSVFFALFLILVILRIFLKIKIITFFAAASLCIALPLLGVYVRAERLNGYTKFSGEEVILSGKVNETRLYGESYYRIDLTDVVVEDNSGEHSINGKVRFSVKPQNLDLADFACGRYITVVGNFNFKSLCGDNVKEDMKYLVYDVVATGYVNFYNIKVSDKLMPTLRDSFRDSIKNKLGSFAGDYADIGYAMLFGDSSVLDADVLATFRSTGIAHLLAVSGLHVSVLVLALNFILKRLHSPKTLNIFIIGALLGFYAYLCDFSVSVIRASLMAVVVLYATLRGKRYDRLTALSIAVLIILSINPLQLFSISFALSFTAVLSIVLLIAPLFRLFNKFLYKPLANTLALIVAVQIGLMVVSIFYFDKISLLGILTNFVSVPIASFAYMLLIFELLLSYIIPPLNIILVSFSWLLSIVVKFNFWSSGLGLILNFADIKLIAVVASLLIMFVVSDYVFIKKNTKAITSVIILLVCTLVSVIALA